MRLRVRPPLVLALTSCVAVAALAGRDGAATTPARWSDPATWGGTLPRAGDTVVVGAGRRVVLDVDPPRLAKLVVDGALVVEDRDVRLAAGAIDVHGVLSVGAPNAPFAHGADIALGGTAPDDGLFSASGGGRIELYGTPRVAWTHLARTAPAGTRDLTLASDVNWEPGDRLALAPSGFDAAQAEEVVVEAARGTNLRLREPLRFAHWGAETDGVDERAEIGLLSHNVRIHGDGAQVVIMRGGTLRASDVEFAGMGRRATLGAYPVHFHLAGDAASSFVASSSVDHSANRCITIHGTSNVRITDDVAFDTVGHCFFLEDGAETGNLLARNLGMLTRAAPASAAILESDVEPATFWIANPDNVLTGNAAAGSDGSGFWYNLTPNPTGPSASRTLWPRATKLGGFDGNVAHANAMNGLFVDNLRNPPGVSEAPNYSPAVLADYRGLTAYKNRRRGAWLRGTNLRVTGARIADNSIGLTFAGANAVLRDSLVVGETENLTGPPKPSDAAFPLRGFEFYDGRVGVERTQFVNFVPSAQRKASALSALEYSPFFTDPSNFARALTFRNAQPVYFKTYPTPDGEKMGADGYRSTVFRDLDGSVTGHAGSSVAIASPFFDGSDCVVHADWNAATCDARFGSLFVNVLDARRVRFGPVRITRLDDPKSSAIVLLGNPREGFTTSFQTNVRPGERYAVRFGGGFPRRVRVALHRVDAGSSIALVLAQAPPGAVVYADRTLRTRVPSERDTSGALIVRLAADAMRPASVDVCASDGCRSGVP